MGRFPFQDMREFMDALEDAGELQRIKAEVDWDVEAGAIVRRCAEIGTPAPFFENIKGYPQGFNRIMGGQLAGSSKGPFRRSAIAMGMDPDTSARELVEVFGQRIANPIKPMVVQTGPCKENILKGSDIDILKFPAPMIHKGDGGRFVGTWHAIITKDPDSEWVNWGMYRVLVHTRKMVSLMIEAWRHSGMHYYQKHEPRGVPMPVAVAMGPDPLCMMGVVTDVPAGVSEVEIAGGLRQEPVRLVKCETNDLYVPATAEIIVEGHVMPGERIEEGPHGEYTGYRVSERSDRERLPMRIDCITHRNNPILPMSCMGMPVDESQSTMSIAHSAAIQNDIRAKGIELEGLFIPPEGAGGGCIFISLKKPYNQILHEVASMVWAHPIGRAIKYVVFVDPTADAYNELSVLHEIIHRCHPIRGIRQFEGGPATPLDPCLTAYERHHMIGACAIIDCTTPIDWPFPPIESRFTSPHLYPTDIQEKVLSRWNEYGYK